MAQKFLQTQEFQLSGSGVTATATSITLESFQTPDETNITDSDLGTTNYGTLEPGTSNEEIISFTAVTQNGDGTATLTGVTRGLKFVSPYTADTSLRKAHAGGTIFVVTNNPQLYEDFASISNDETITGTWTFDTAAFPRMEDATNDPTSGAMLTTKAYVDALALGGTLTTDKVVVEATAGETVAAGEIVYFDETDDEWKLADASAAGTAENILLGVAQGAGTNGNGISGGVLLSALDGNQTGLSAGELYYLSDTAGAISTSAGTKDVVIGYAKSATELYFKPNFKRYVTKDQQDALAGVGGTPSSTNKYVTEDYLVGEIKGYAGAAAPTGWLLCNGSAVSNDTYSDLVAVCLNTYGLGSATAFTADSSTDIFTDAAHGLSNGNILLLENSGGALPTGLSAGTVYYVISATTDTFQLSTTSGGSAVDISDNGSGTQNYYTQFKVPDLRGNVPVGKDSGTFGTLGASGGVETVTLTAAQSGLPAHTHGADVYDSAGGSVLGFKGQNTGNTANIDVDSVASAAASEAHTNLQPYLVINYIIKT